MKSKYTLIVYVYKGKLTNYKMLVGMMRSIMLYAWTLGRLYGVFHMISLLHIGRLLRPIHWPENMDITSLFSISFTLPPPAPLFWIIGTPHQQDITKSTLMGVSRMDLRVVGALCRTILIIALEYSQHPMGTDLSWRLNFRLSYIKSYCSPT